MKVKGQRSKVKGENMTRNRTLITWALVAASAVAFAAGASTPRTYAMGGAVPEQPAIEGQRGGGAGGGGAQGGGQGGGRAQGPRPYAEVITAAAKTDDGIFKVHRITEGSTDNLFYEIPKNELNKDYLWNTQLKKTTIGAGYGGQSVGTRVVRWVLRGDKVLLQNVDYSMMADPANPMIDDANTPAIIRTFDVAAYAANGDPVINVGQLFTGNVPEFAAWRADRRARCPRCEPHVPRKGRVVSDERQRGSHRDVGHGRGTQRAAPAPAPAGRAAAAAAARGPSATVLVHHSMIKLPETPMMPRLFDERVGYFTQGLMDFGTGEQQQMQKRFITRYRLEKKDPNAAVSEPVKPIIYWVDPTTPKKWVPYVKKGIEDWQPAFEMAGLQERHRRQGSL